MSDVSDYIETTQALRDLSTDRLGQVIRLLQFELKCRKDAEKKKGRG